MFPKLNKKMSVIYSNAKTPLIAGGIIFSGDQFDSGLISTRQKGIFYRRSYIAQPAAGAGGRWNDASWEQCERSSNYSPK